MNGNVPSPVLDGTPQGSSVTQAQHGRSTDDTQMTPWRETYSETPELAESGREARVKAWTEGRDKRRALRRFAFSMLRLQALKLVLGMLGRFEKCEQEA